MRKLLFLIILACIASVNYAQKITGSSSVEDCVKLLNAAAQNAAGKNQTYNYTSTISFTGGTLVEIQDWNSLIAKETYYNIDWSTFDKITQTTTSNGEIFVMFNFNSKNIYKETIETDNKTSLVTKKEVSEAMDYFHFYLPASKEALIKDIEVAANRLAQLSKEKGNLFTSTPKSKSKIKQIEGKPSYEETVNYINTFLKDGAPQDLFCNTVTFQNRQAYVGERSNGKIYLSSSYTRKGSYSSGSPMTNENFLIDLSNIEEIRVVRGEGFEGGCCQFGLWFIEKGKSASAVMHLPLWKGAESQSNSDYKEQKVYKAFNHLRAIIGAPEPLNF